MELRVVDKEFNRITQLVIRQKVTKAFVQLDYDTKDLGKEHKSKIIHDKANRLKQELTDYIDSLEKMLLGN